MGDGVAPCLECAATITIFTVEEGQVVDRFDFPLRSREPLDRIRLLRDQQVDTIICGGVQDVFEDLLRASGIEMISWVTGNTDDLIGLFLKGRLVPGRQSEQSDSGHGSSGESTQRKKDI
jgi:predicted Fe-Mo cluster-binding NifX family protein